MRVNPNFFCLFKGGNVVLPSLHSPDFRESPVQHAQSSPAFTQGYGVLQVKQELQLEQLLL